MSEMSFEQMLEDSFKTIHNGEVVEGTVIDVKEDEIILNIGCKADGIITKNEYSNEAGIDLKSAQRWMGHADEQMILRVYAHLTDRQEQRATEKLRAFMAG